MEESWHKECFNIVAAIVIKREWKLVTDLERLAIEICSAVEKQGSLEPELLHQAIENAAIRHYSPVLYEACRANGLPQQRLAFEELSRHLYSIAVKKVQNDDLAQELTQQAIVNTYKNLARVRDPSEFIAYTWMILLNVVRSYFRRVKRSHEELVPFDDDAIEPGIETESADITYVLAGLVHQAQAHPDPTFNHAMRDEFREQFQAAIRSCVKHQLQQAVLIEYFIKHDEYHEIAQELGIKVNYVHQLRHLGLKTLLACEAFIQFVEEWKS